MEKQQLPEIEEGDEQRRDAMLLKLLKTPPQPRSKRSTLNKPAEVLPSESVERRKTTKVAKILSPRQNEKGGAKS